jgi:hypothetical protein
MEKPDKWMLVKVNGATPHWRIFASWSDAWRLNSGVSSVDVKDDYIDFVGYSGSVYRCRKTGYGVTGYGSGILCGLLDKSGETLSAVWEEPKDIVQFMETL